MEEPRTMEKPLVVTAKCLTKVTRILFPRYQNNNPAEKDVEKLNKQQEILEWFILEKYAMAELSGVKYRKNWFVAHLNLKKKKKSMFQ